MRKVKITLAVCIALVFALGAYTLTRSPPRVVGGHPFWPTDPVIAQTTHDISICQADEVLPAHVSALRLSLWAFVGWDIHVVAYRGARVLAEGRRGADWTSDSVTVPVRPLDRASSGVTLCFAIGPNSEPVLILGTRTPRREAARVLTSDTPRPDAKSRERLGGRVGVEYLAAGRGSWWSRILTVARHMGLGRAFSGSWIALLIAALMGGVVVLALRLTMRELS